MAVLTTPKGRQPAILDPIMYWSFVQGKVPARNLAPGAPWPGWNLIYDTANGAQLTIRNPQVAITGDKRGRLRGAPGEDFGVAVGLDNRTPTEEFVDMVSNFQSKILAAVAAAAGTEAMPETTVKHFDRRKKTRFMLGLEGVAEAGTFRDVDTLVRCVIYWAEDSANAEHIWRSAGADSIFHANTTLEALPSSITPAMVEGTGYQVGDLDPDGRFNYFYTPLGT